MNDIDRVGFLETNLMRQLGWIAAADSKGSFAFAINTAMLGLLAAVSPKSSAAWNCATDTRRIACAKTTVIQEGKTGDRLWW